MRRAADDVRGVALDALQRASHLLQYDAQSVARFEFGHICQSGL
jgi:hypothetical protein